MAKRNDFSKVPGPRLRIALAKYEPERRNFKPVSGMSAMVTVANGNEQRRLWRAIEDTIQKGDWRDGGAAGGDPVSASATETV